MAEEKASKTLFTILQKQKILGDREAWEEVGEAEGDNRKSAVLAFVASQDEGKSGDFKAVPQRSWKGDPIQIKWGPTVG